MYYREVPEFIETPKGPARLIEFDGIHGTATVILHSNDHVAIYPAEQCFIPAVEVCREVTAS
jgi:hypothetical protein